MKSRIVFVFLLLVGAWGIIVARSVWLQILPNARLSQLQKRQFERQIQVESRRGAIIDRQGKELAVTINTQSLFVDPSLVTDPYTLAKRLQSILKIPFQTLYKIVRRPDSRFVWIKHNLSEQELAQVKALENRALGFVEEPKRVYPNEKLASQTLGFVGREGRGLEGLELEYDSLLRGKTRRILALRDARGRPLLKDMRELTDVPDGTDIQLTIDSELQFVLESELSAAIEEHEAQFAYGVILDAKTSEILALANAPQFDVNQATRYPREIRRNKAVTDSYEPGSTMKTLVVAGALRKNIIKPSTKIDCEGGRMKVGPRWIREADEHHKFNQLTVTEVLAQSSNVGVAKIAFEMGEQELFNTLKDFGFGEKYEFGFPGESKGIINPLPWKKHLFSNVAFGQGMTATPLQVANAYAAIANGGVLKRPRLVKAIHQDGEWKELESEEIRRVLSESQASTMTLMLTAATSATGTGAKARISGYPVGGKTGTAQKVDLVHGGYLKQGYISSFAGFAPAHEPKFVIYIAVDNPKKAYYGSQVAAPVFSRVAQYAVRKAGLAPVLLSEKDILPPDPEKSRSSLQAEAIRAIQNHIQSFQYNEVPNLKGLSLREVLRRLNGGNLAVKIKGSGWVSRTHPSAGEPIPKNRQVELILEE